MIEVKASEAEVGNFYEFKDFSDANGYGPVHSPVLKTLMNDHPGQIITVLPADDGHVFLEVEFGHFLQTFTVRGDCLLEEIPV